MKTSTTTLVFLIGLVAVGGLFGSTIFGMTGTKNNEASTAATGLITGHVVTTLTDSDGNILAYRQSDNIIVNNGENCVAKLLFQGSTGAAGTNVCTGANTTGFRFIAIGTGTGAAAADNVVLGTARTDGNLAPKAATVTWTNSTGTGSTQATVQLSTTFTNDSGGAVAVAESGLFNSTSVNSGGMFARQQFSAVNMNVNDQLTVTWTVNIGGT
jgi:hypothetical protein